MAIKIIQKITSLFRKNSENVMTGARKVNNKTKVKLTQEPDTFVSKVSDNINYEDVERYMPKEALKHRNNPEIRDFYWNEYWKTIEEGKKFHNDFQNTIAERRKLRQQNKS